MSLRYGQAPQLMPISDAGAAYRLVRGRIDALVRGRDGIAELAVPACPGWTVRQVVAHVAGVAQDIVTLNLEKKGTGPGRTRRSSDWASHHRRPTRPVGAVARLGVGEPRSCI